ncbi:protein FAM200B-like [Aphis gossypii]|uniref:protein FAM200B-like n=1 Tax=Aphis gossypii TaxID=80765 RepID=UPI002158A676|nr:protein FAM200B-like [Aphis gossypii]
MDKFLIKRPMNSDDESAIETKVRKVSEMSSDVQTSRKVNKKDRKYQDSYIKFGFTFDVEKGEPKCVICLERLASESMKPSKLKRHLVTKHPQFQHKEEDFFKRYENSIEVQKNTMRNFSSVSIKALAASLEASYLIAKTKKPHSIEINEIPWSMCVSICTDGAAALTGSKKGFKAKVLEVSSNIMFNHCMIHREALASKKLQPDVNKVLLNAISVINFIKSKSLNSRLFTILCNEMGSDHEKLLLHTEVRWLSRGKILSRLFELRDEARIFLLEQFLSDNDVDINMIKEIITTHLISLQTNFNARFEDFPEESLGNLKISEELIDLSSDENLRIRFQQNACDTFWISIKSEYPELSKQAISILLTTTRNDKKLNNL